MKYPQEEIIHALEVIKETCREHEKCADCPFYNKSILPSCEIQYDNPEDWQINKDQDVWRAFRR